MESKAVRMLSQSLDAPAPGFWCIAAGGNKRSRVQVEHHLNPAASTTELAKLRELTGESFSALEPFYSQWNGGLFYAEGARSAEWILELYPVERMEAEHAGLELWMEGAREYPEDWPADEIARILSAVVIGQPPASPDQVAVMASGAAAGKVFQFDHETLNIEERAQSFEAFLRRLVSDPARLSYDLGCMCRYHGAGQQIPYFYSENILEFDAPPELPEWY